MQELAAELAAQIETAQRDPDDDATTYYRLKDGAPEWCRDVLREAHGTDHNGAPAMLPDDYRYEYAAAAAEAIAEADDADELERRADELEADPYTHDLTGWLHSHAGRVAYLDDAGELFGAAELDGWRLLAAAQVTERREVFDLVRSSLEARADDDA
jgi:hypothetical protein